MPDKYASFSQLYASEPEGAFQIELRQMDSPFALIAPHAGKIEVGTSEICRSVAGSDLTYYLFQGCKPNRNSDLHITSSRFDEPQGLIVAHTAKIVVTFHGQAGPKSFVNVGGRSLDLGRIIIDALKASGYTADRHNTPNLQGLDPSNICNRGSTAQGVQLEISRGLRDRLIADEHELKLFSSCIRTALNQYEF